MASFITPSSDRLYQAAYSLYGVLGSQATRTCDASENFFTKQDAKRDAARNALMRLESSPDQAFATARTGNCCQEGRTALGIMTSPHKLGQSHEEEDIEFAAEHHREPRCAFDDCPLPPYTRTNMVKLMPAVVNHTNGSGKPGGPETMPTCAPSQSATESLIATKLVSPIRAVASPPQMNLISELVSSPA